MLGTRAYDPETLAILRHALEQAVAALPPSQQTHQRKMLLAARILAMGARGERDVGRLLTAALVNILPSIAPESKAH